MRLIARFAKEKEDEFEVITVYDEHIERENIPKTDPRIETISKKHPSAIWFERKMTDDFGIAIENAFDKRRLVHQERFPKGIHPMRKEFTKKSLDFAEYEPYNYEEIKGDGVFCVPVGPIHAGIIEPGHFHFSQAGEDILHLEVRHFYKYRGIEKMCEGKTLKEARKIIERISGNESVAYQIAWRDILLAATKTELTGDLQKRHAFLLELERLIHHLTDLGFIANDAGFGAALAFCSRLAEDSRKMMKQLTGHRFGFGAIRFDDVKFDVTAIREWLKHMRQEILFFEAWITDIPSLWDRFDTTGILRREKCIKYDVVGVMARACGIMNDRRASEFYENHGFIPALEKSGDVAARFKVRLAEAKNSLEMMHNFAKDSSGTLKIGDAQDGEYTGFVESSLGELFMYVEIKNGVIERFFARDPSFVNWQALYLLMPENIIADFPLINKSCDLSYAGSDL